jgi:multimeric flavodoxin WrbA
MKILGIRASGRTNGNSFIILNELLRPAKERGFEISELNLAALNLKHCTGCFGCNNAELKCVIKDDLEQVKEQIAAADGIALVSPAMP